MLFSNTLNELLRSCAFQQLKHLFLRDAHLGESLVQKCAGFGIVPSTRDPTHDFRVELHTRVKRVVERAWRRQGNGAGIEVLKCAIVSVPKSEERSRRVVRFQGKSSFVVGAVVR